MSSFFKSSGTSVTIQNTIDTLITDAEAAKIAAQTAATNASTSASLSSTSANNSSTSATNSASSLSSAQSAQGASETARDASVVAKNSAETAATNSGNSASTASTQASNASTSATNASNSATTATTKASEASTSATNAASSASTASGHVTTASTQASNASTSATNAASSASTATTKASEASTSATNASTSASTATTKASEASTSATNASTSASTASTQATNAGNSATASANSATAAGNSATAASSSASTAQTLSTSFNNIYLGALSSAPSQDPDGSALDEGDLYFDTTQGELKVYKSSGWAAAGSTVNGTSARFHYDITGTPTSVSGADAAGNTLAYDAGFLDVYVNGVRMSTADITTTSGNAVVFAEALSASDEVDIVAYGTFVISQLNASNLNSGTIPDARFPATLPAISGANLTNLPVDLTALSASNLNSGTIPSARVSGAYTGITSVGTLTGTLTANGGAVFNEASANVDFRVEGNNDTHALFVQGGSDHVGINNNSPNSSFTGADNLVIGGGSGHTGMTILSGTSSRSSIEFSDGTGSDATKTAGGIRYYHDSNYMRFNTNGGTERMRIDSSGRVGIGTSTIPTADSTVTVRKDGAANEFNILSGTSHASVINMGDADDYNIQRIKADNSSNSLQFQTNNAERMRIDSSGNVAIGGQEGTSSIANQRLLLAATAQNGIGYGLFIHNDSYLAASARISLSPRYTFSYNTSPYIESLSESTSAAALVFGATTGTTATERMRIDSLGSLGIGNTVMSSMSTDGNNLVVGSGSGNEGITIYSATNGTSNIYFADGSSGGDRYKGFLEYAHSGDYLNIGTGGTANLRIHGNGTTAFGSTANDARVGIHADSGTMVPLLVNSTKSGTGAGNLVRWRRNNTNVGEIEVTGSSTSYVTSSDYRMKENVVTEWDATTRLKQLKPSRFNFIIDADTTVDGFLAHEVSSVVPEAVSGTKDAVDADGNAVMQGIDHSKLVPLLVKTIQELEARITALESA
jgi:hypothetical protein